MNMKKHSFYLQLITFLLLSHVTAHAIELASAKVLHVKGLVTYTSLGQEEKALTTGTILFEGHSISTSNDSTAYLLFSNGSELTVKENSNLIISEFQQAPFDASSSDDYPKRDLSKSSVVLNLSFGSVEGHVRGLNSVSKFEVETILGTASILGTRFNLELYFDRLINEFAFNVQNVDGRVNLTSSFVGILKFGRFSNVIINYSSDNDAIQTVSIPPSRSVSIRGSGTDPKFSSLVLQFPEFGGSAIDGISSPSTLNPFISDQVITPSNAPEVSPNGT